MLEIVDKTYKVLVFALGNGQFTMWTGMLV
jgi:hypothetical protein